VDFREGQRGTNPRLENGYFPALDSLSFSNAMSINEFLNVLEENIVYDISGDDKIIEKLVSVFSPKNTDESNKIDEDRDDSNELPIINATAVLENLNNVRLFLLQQEETGRQLKVLD
ncbi:19332_t:CDS:2, partial [Racocetra persica]